MIRATFYFYFVLGVLFFTASCQEYDFGAEISRQCLVPDPVGLLDCVENKVTLPYLTSWVDCTNSLGQNVRTSADIINYRCKSVWEGKGVIPEVFYIKDCVIEKTGLPAKNVSAEVLGAYKECESTPTLPQQRIKTAPVQQQFRTSSVEYKPPNQQIQVPQVQPPLQVIQLQKPIQQIQVPVLQPPQQVIQVQTPVQQIRAPVFQLPHQPLQVQIPFQQSQPAVIRPLQPVQGPLYQSPVPVSFQTRNAASKPQFGSIFTKPVQAQQRPVQQQIAVAAPNPVHQVPVRTVSTVQQTHSRPAQLSLSTPSAFKPQHPPPASKPQYTVIPSAQRQPYSQQFFTIYPQAPLPNQQQNFNRAILSQKTVPTQSFVSQQLIPGSAHGSSATLNAPYTYSFQIHHPLQSAF